LGSHPKEGAESQPYGAIRYPPLLNSYSVWCYQVSSDGNDAVEWIPEFKFLRLSDFKVPPPWEFSSSEATFFIDVQSQGHNFVQVASEDDVGGKTFTRWRLQSNIVLFLINTLGTTLVCQCPQCVGKGLSICKTCESSDDECLFCRGTGVYTCELCEGAGELRKQGGLAKESESFGLRLSKIVVCDLEEFRLF
jgi:hypothetical protein